MHNLKFKTKIEIITIILLIIILTTFSVSSVTRTITDTHDDFDTFIRNSNGNYWAATGDNIQIAIDDFGISAPIYGGYGGSHGTVWLSGNTTLTITSTITVNDHVTLEMDGCEIKPSGNFDVFLLNEGAKVRNGIVDVSDIADFSSAVIRFNSADKLETIDHNAIVENMRLESALQRGTAIYLDTSGATGQIIAFVHVNNIQMGNFEYGIYIDHTSTGDSYVNGNMFTNIEIVNTKYCMRVYESIAEASGNYFENIKCYCSGITEYIIWNNGHGNQFDNIQAFNWNNNSGTRIAYVFTEGFSGDWSGPAHCCYLNFRGGGNDIAFPIWHQWNNAYTIFNLENGELITGKVTEYKP